MSDASPDDGPQPGSGTAYSESDVRVLRRSGFLPLSRGGRVAAAVLLLIVVGSVGRTLVWFAERESAMDLANLAAAPPHTVQWPFDFTVCLIPKEEIRGGGPPKNGIPALTAPDVLPAGDATYLHETDRVVGVTLGGHARAYPIRILNWHENVNDTLGERLVAVTYCPLCDSAVVFDRNIDGKPFEFGISGLLYNSNVLLYDRQPNGEGESLWSQLQMRAVTGPAAERGLKLTPLPSDLTTWGEWRSRYPETTVLSDRTGHTRDYGRNPYAAYFNSDRLMFPVNPRPNEAFGLRYKDRLVAIRVGTETRAYPVRNVLRAAGPDGAIEQKIGPATFRLTYLSAAEGVRVEPIETAGHDYGLGYTFWFAWSAMHPDTPVFVPPPAEPAPPGSR